MDGFTVEEPDNASLGMCALGLVDHNDVLTVAGGVMGRPDPVTFPGFEGADVFGGARRTHVYDGQPARFRRREQ